MKKNNRSPFPRFLQIPWWLSVLAAIVSYCLLKYLVPQLQFSNSTIEDLAIIAPRFAPPAAILFLLLAAIRLYDSDQSDTTNDEEDKESFDR
ncbi:MAG: hypothetical protein JRJ68_12030 [Deltaproteobacteria bacterium]|nr:hypothetical protein [Deltaproteobacteria bacterium]